MKFDVYKILSYVLSPPAFAFYITMAFAMTSPVDLVMGSVFLSLIPAFVITRFGSKVFENDSLERNSRTKLYLISIASYLAASGIFWLLGSQTMLLISLSYLLVTGVIASINLFWKISAHSAGVAGPVTVLVFAFGAGMIPLYLLTLLVMWVRFKLKAHNVSQLIAGALVAVSVTSSIYAVIA